MSCLGEMPLSFGQISLDAVFQFPDFFQLKGGVGRGVGRGVVRQSTHKALGDLLSLAGVCQGAHTDLRLETPEQGEVTSIRRVPWQLSNGSSQAGGLLEWEG